MWPVLFYGSLYSSGKPVRSPRKGLRVLKFEVDTNTAYLKTARKGGGHKGNNVNIKINLM